MAGTRAAIRYAKAILDMADSIGVANEVNNDMILIASTIKSNAELNTFIQSPTISVEVKEKALLEVFASKFKIIKKEVLKELNLIQDKIAFTEIYSKVDPSVVKKEIKLTSNKKLSNKAAKIWANLSQTLDDSP
ncbi:F0F1 ATP synthase subunit delta, partial [Chryseobacterium cucumeris]|uniref:F0F1 ATP synthase subunit delta n=1 Tax=Chryseobacterium cucumeris TaxID=1813611 RepID=UPI0023F279B2